MSSIKFNTMMSLTNDALSVELAPDVISDFKLYPGNTAILIKHIPDILSDDVAYSYRYNMLKRQPERKVGDTYNSFDANSDKSWFTTTINSILQANGLKKFSKTDMCDVYTIWTHANNVDPFYEKVKSIKWDGKPRLERWFIDGLGAYIPNLSEEESEALVKDITLSWFMSALDRHEDHRSVAEVIPILKGGQGLGKTTFVKYTAMEDDWYKSTAMSGDDPKQYFESISGGKIVEWGEAGQLRKGRDIGNLKQFISNDIDTYRAPYDTYPTSNPRLWVAIITTNDSTLFIDTSGNRRFFPIECSAERRKFVVTYDNMRSAENQYEVEQLWAEAYLIYVDRCKKYGGTPKACLTPEHIALAEVAQKNYVVHDDFKDAVYERLNDIYPDVGTQVLVQEVKDIMNSLASVEFPEYKYKLPKISYLLDYRPGEWIRKNNVTIYNEDGTHTSRNVIIRVKKGE